MCSRSPNPPVLIAAHTHPMADRIPTRLKMSIRDSFSRKVLIFPAKCRARTSSQMKVLAARKSRPNRRSAINTITSSPIAATIRVW